MSSARDKLHILLLSIFLCVCIFLVFGLIGERKYWALRLYLVEIEY